MINPYAPNVGNGQNMGKFPLAYQQRLPSMNQYGQGLQNLPQFQPHPVPSPQMQGAMNTMIGAPGGPGPQAGVSPQIQNGMYQIQPLPGRPGQNAWETGQAIAGNGAGYGGQVHNLPKQLPASAGSPYQALAQGMAQRMQSNGMQRVSPGLYRNAQGKIVRG